MQRPKPPICTVKGAMIHIQVNYAKLPNTRDGNLMKSVETLYSCLSLETLRTKKKRPEKFREQLTEIQTKIGALDPAQLLYVDSSELCLDQSVERLVDLFSLSTLLKKWWYEAQYWWWQRKCKLYLTEKENAM